MTSPEYISFGPTVDAIGNHAAKMATLLMLAREPDTPFSQARLAGTFNSVQGSEPGWILSHGSRRIPFNYCLRSMVPLLADETRVPAKRGSGTVEAVRINQQGLSLGVPLSGAMLGWELTYPHTSAVRILGQTSSSSDKRMPSLRLKVFEHLLRAKKPVSTTELQKAAGEGSGRRFMSVVPNLRDAGILDVSEAYDPAQRTVHLSEPDFKQLAAAGVKARPETHALYAVVKELVDNNKTTMTGQELLAEVTRRYPAHDHANIWHRLSGTGRGRSMHFIEVEPFNGAPGQLTNITIGPAYVDAIRSLVESVRRLEDKEQFRTDMAEQAHEIIEAPEQVAALMAKAHRFSIFSNSHTDSEWREHVLAHIPPEGIDTRTLYERVKSTTAPISYPYFRMLLAEQQGNGYKIDRDKAQGRKWQAIGWVAPLSQAVETE